MVDLLTKEFKKPRYGANGIATLHFHVMEGSCMILHWHERLEILRVLEGELVFWRNEQGPYSVKAGELAIVCPRQLHRGVSGSEGVRYDVVMFETATFFTMHELSQGLLVLDPVCASPQAVEAFDQLKAEEDPVRCAGKAYYLMGLLFSLCQPVLHPIRASEERFLHAVRYVQEHFQEPITTKEVSERFSYDQAYFCRQFKRITGMTLLSYLETLRLEQACAMLRMSEDSISSISEQIGFRDVSYFSTRFHRHFGITPSQFRKKGIKTRPESVHSQTLAICEKKEYTEHNVQRSE